MDNVDKILNKLGMFHCDFSSLETGDLDDIRAFKEPCELDFMRKSRYLKIRHKFKGISCYVKEIVEKANNNDILMIHYKILPFGMVVMAIKVVNDEDYIDLAFGD
jgi:hypoxanthine-guanine phosphoribosyltransferase